jgi:hypothetical protein
MDEIEKKALALLQECGFGGGYIRREWNGLYEALCRAIEQHEAFRQEVSDAVSGVIEELRPTKEALLSHFIIAKPDPLVEALFEARLGLNGRDADTLRAALAARGLEIREIEK